MSESGSVLIVDDKVPSLNRVGLLLTRAGHKVAQATTGAVALRLARQIKPDLILLDVVLPDLSGLEVLRQIKADIEMEQTSVVLFSAQAVSADHYCAGLDTGADGYIASPIPDQELLARVRMHLRQHGRVRVARASETRFRDLIAHQADAVLVIDEAGLILFANPAAQTLYGRPAATLVGLPFDFPLACATRKEIHLHRPGASDIVAEMRVAPSQWEGKPAWVASLRDITESQIFPRNLQDGEKTQQMLAIRLNEEKGRLLAAQAVAKIGSWETDLATLEVTWSAQTHRIFETDAASFRPTHAAFLQLVHPDDRKSVEKAFFQSLKSTGPFAVEHRVQLPDGRLKYVEERWQNFTEGPRNTVKAIGTCHDITERKQAEQAQARLLNILETSLNEVYYFDPDSLRFAYVNPEALRNLGYALETMKAMTPLDLKPEFTEDSLRQLIAPLMHRERAQQRFETIQRRADGSHYPVEVILQMVERQNKQMLLAVIRNNTERRQAELARDESEDRFRLLWQTCPNAIVLTDRNSIIRYANPALQQVFGHDPAALIGNSLALLQPQHLAAAHIRGMQRHLETGQRSMDWRAVETTGLHKEGHEFPIEITFSSMDINGELMFAGFIRDVTARKQVEQELRNSEHQLRQSQRLESIGQLTGGVAHDFNNLLTVILGNAELLQEALIQDPAHQELASMIGSAAQRGAELTQRLLAFARKQPLDPEPLDVNRLIAGFDPLLRRTLGEHIEIALTRGPNLWHALADASQLESALLNLCINSRDAMPDGGTLSIETANMRLDQEYASRYSELRPGDYVMLAVSDDGHGMEPKVVARVFEPFFTTKETGKGSGLGLSMVYGFVKQSNGHVSVYSEPGHGTTVRLYLPRVSEPGDNPTHASDQAQLGGGCETILLVEDDELVRAYTRRQLAALGYEVMEAPNGNYALDILRSGAAIDLLFTDVVMPGMGGHQLAEQARLLRPRLKVLYTSGYAENAIVHHGKLDPDVHLLSKPYRRSALANKLREVLDG